MATETRIGWCDFSSNPIKYRHNETGKVVWACVKKSAGCGECYAEKLALRWNKGAAFSRPNIANVTPFVDDKELRWLLTSTKIAGKRVFIGDMTDIFGSWVTDAMLDRLFAVFASRADVTFQLLTKRPDRMARYIERLGESLQERLEPAARSLGYTLGLGDVWQLDWPLPAVWLGTSVEDQQAANVRIPHLLATPAAVRFLSCEPLLGRVDLAAYMEAPTRERHQTNGRTHLRGCPASGDGDRQRGASLAGGQARGEPLDSGRADECVRACTCGASSANRISPGQSDDRRSSIPRVGTSPGLAPLVRPDSSRIGHQPQEWTEGRQPSEQSGDDDRIGERSSRRTGAEGRTNCASEGVVESRSETDNGSGEHHPSETSGWGAVESDSGGLRSLGSNDLEDSARRPVGSLISWLICGGESGPKHRQMDLDWLRQIVSECRLHRVPAFVEQDSGPYPGRQGRIPDELMKHQFPVVSGAS